MAERPAFFRRVEGGFEPTDIGDSIWDPSTVGGMAVGGLLSVLLDEAPPAPKMHTARLVIDILGQVPRKRLEGRTVVLREGRRMSMVASELVVDGRVAARATALRVRTADTPPAPAQDRRLPPPEEVPLAKVLREDFCGDAIRTRPIYGAMNEPGPGAMWVAFDLDIVAGVPLTATTRSAMIGDFGNGVGSMLPGEPWSFANLDIAMHFLRAPQGDWMAIEAVTESAGNGHAITSNLFSDQQGVFGRGCQTLFVAPADPNKFV